MPDTFDPSLYASGPECVQALREQGVTVNQRLGARLFALGAKGLRFSLAFLEEASTFLMEPAWAELPDHPTAPDLQKLLADARVLELNGELHIVTPDEVPSTALVPKAATLFPTVLGGVDTSRLGGLNWDRRRWEQATHSLLDSDDPRTLVENFRYLFRTLMTAGENPSGLLVTALSRGKLELSREVARQVAEHLNRDLGRALEDVFETQPGRVRDGLNFLLGEGSRSWPDVVASVVLPALTGLLEQSQGDIVYELLPRLAPLLPPDAARLEPFLDQLLHDLPELQHSQRTSLAQFITNLQERCAPLADYLLRRMRATGDPDALAYYGYVLSRLRLEPEQHEECCRHVVELFSAHGLDVALQERLRLTLTNLGPGPLAELTASPRRDALKGPQRGWLITIWGRLRADGLPLPAPELFVELARHELRASSRASLLTLVRSRQLNLPELREALLQEKKQQALLQFLLGEAARLEPPDDDPVLELLGWFGAPAWEAAFARLREETALDSASSSPRLLLFARLLGKASAAGTGQPERFRELVSELPGLPLFGPKAMPSAYLALGYLGSVAELDDAQRLWAWEKLEPHLEALAQVAVESALRLHEGGSPELRKTIEKRLRSVVTAQEPDRVLLQTVLSGLALFLQPGSLPTYPLSLGGILPQDAAGTVDGSLEDPDALVGDLCRTVLNKAPVENLEKVMQRALRYSSEGDGVQMPVAWGKMDRDLAMRVLGALASHPATGERLHRMLVVRLFSFLEDWMEAIRSGKDLYGSRDTPLWELLCHVLERRPGEVGLELASEAAVRLLELHRQVPAHLGLPRRENVQRFLYVLIVQDVGASLRLRGVAVDLPAMLVGLLVELSRAVDVESPVSLYFLQELAALPLREPLHSEPQAYR